MTDRALSISAIALSVATIVFNAIGYFKPNLTSKIDTRYQVQGENLQIGIDNVNGLQDALNAKADSNHKHDAADIKDIQDALNAKADN